MLSGPNWIVSQVVNWNLTLLHLLSTVRRLLSAMSIAAPAVAAKILAAAIIPGIAAIIGTAVPTEAGRIAIAATGMAVMAGITAAEVLKNVLNKRSFK